MVLGKEEAKMRYFLFISAVFFLVGCSVRSYTVEKERVDTQREGNLGYLSGNPPATEAKKENRLGNTRKISVTEIELGSYVRKEEGKNKFKTEYVPNKQSISEEEEDFSRSEAVDEEDYPQVASAAGQAQWYTIEKNDTLQKISQKFYSTTKKWKLIFEYNQDILKSPDKIYPGKKIKIPDLD